MSKVRAIANQKGGVGKTTTAINLSAALGEKGKRVLLIDADPQGNATSGLGIEKDQFEKSTYHMMIGEEDIHSCILDTAFQNLSICPSGEELGGAEVELVYLENREFRIRDAVFPIRQEYDFIFIDCPPSLGLITLNCLTSADSVLIPLQCEYFALEGVSQLISNVRRIKKSLNPSIDIEGVLLTMLDSRTNLGLQVVEEVKEVFPSKVYSTIIPRNVRLSEAPSFGQPIHIYDKISKGAQSYMMLAEEVMEQNR